VHPPTENPYKYSEEDMVVTLEFAQTIVEGQKYEGAHLTFTDVSVGIISIFLVIELVTNIYSDEVLENETDVLGVAPSSLGTFQIRVVKRILTEQIEQNKK